MDIKERLKLKQAKSDYKQSVKKGYISNLIKDFQDSPIPNWGTLVINGNRIA